MHLVRSEEGVRAWCEARGVAPGAILSLPVSWRLAVAWFGDVLDPAFRGHPPGDAARRFRAAGFTGRFWDASAADSGA